MNYVCNHQRNGRIRRKIWCLSSSSETSCSGSYTEPGEQIVTGEGIIVSESLCSPPFVLTSRGVDNFFEVGGL